MRAFVHVLVRVVARAFVVCCALTLRAGRARAGGLSVMWSAPTDFGGVSSVTYSLRVNGAVVYSGTATSAVVGGLAPSTMYAVAVRAESSAGAGGWSADAAFSTIGATKPGRPAPPTPFNVSGGMACLHFAPPTDIGGAPLSGWHVYMAELMSPVSACTAPGTAQCSLLFDLSGVSRPFACAPRLKFSTTYGFRLAALNGLLGAASEIAVITTTDLTVSTPPANFRALFANARDFTLAWSEPVDLGGAPLLAYGVEMRPVGGSAWDAVGSNVTTRSAKATAYLGGGLTSSTAYEARVRAFTQRSAASGGSAGEFGDSIVVSTLAAVPGYLTWATATASVSKGAPSVTLSIARVNGTEGVITGTIRVAGGTATAGNEFVLGAGLVTVQDAVHSGTYSMQVLHYLPFSSPDGHVVLTLSNVESGGASNMTLTFVDDGRAGTVQFSRVTASVSAAAPGVSLTLTRTVGVSSAITVYYAAQDGTGAAGTDYTAPAVPASVQLGDAQASAVVTIGVRENPVYSPYDRQFRVVITGASPGVTWAGTANASVTVTLLDNGVTSVPSAPPPPTVLTGQATGGSVVLALSPSVSTGGRALSVTRYTVYVAAAGSSVYAAAATVVPAGGAALASVPVYGLQASFAYSVYVTASNVVGESPRSGTVVASTSPPTVPGAAAAPLETYVGGGRIELVWVPPPDTGGLPLTGWAVEVWAGSLQGQLSSVPRAAGDLTLAQRVTGLAANTPHFFRVTASNAVGLGAPGAARASSTRAVAAGPSAPAGVSMTAATGGAAALTWTAPDDSGGTPLLGYYVYYYSVGAAATWVRAPGFPGPPAYALQGLAASTTYGVAVQAVSAYTAAAGAVLPGAVSVAAGSAVLHTSADCRASVQPGDTLQLAGRDFVVVGGPASAFTAAAIPLAGAPASGHVNATAAFVGALSAATTLTTLSPTLPQAPPAPLLLARTGGLLRVRLAPPADTGGVPLLGFRLLLSARGGVFKDVFPPSDARLAIGAGGSSVVDVDAAGLLAATDYALASIALNVMSTCLSEDPAVSPPANASTYSASLPSVPATLTAAPAGATGGQLPLTWAPSHDLGGFTSINYVLRVAPGCAGAGAVVHNDSAHAATVVGLTALSAYCFTVTAVSPAGSSAATPPLQLSTPAETVPGAMSVSCGGASGGSVVVAIVPPADTGGAPVTAYRLYVGGVLTVVQAASAGTSIAAYHLTPLRNYTCVRVCVPCGAPFVARRTSRLCFVGVLFTVACLAGSPQPPRTRSAWARSPPRSCVPPQA